MEASMAIAENTKAIELANIKKLEVGVAENTKDIGLDKIKNEEIAGVGADEGKAIAENTKAIELASFKKEEMEVTEKTKGMGLDKIKNEESKAIAENTKAKELANIIKKEEMVVENTKGMGLDKIKNEEIAFVGADDGKAIATTTGIATATGDVSQYRKIRIQVSNTKKPFSFYLRLAKKYIKLYNDVELTALGMAIPNVVMISEILKSNGFAVQKNIVISTVAANEDWEGRSIKKAKIEIQLGKKIMETIDLEDNKE